MITKDKPKCCNMCGCSIGNVFYDAATRQGWGDLCPLCFKQHGRGLGVGKGQEYTLNYETGLYEQTLGGSASKPKKIKGDRDGFPISDIW